jgi:hypothetical protein
MTTALEGVRGQRHASAALYPEKDPVPIVQEAGWAPGPVWTGAEYLPSHRDSIPGPSSPKSVAIPTEQPGPLRNSAGLLRKFCVPYVKRM